MVAGLVGVLIVGVAPGGSAAPATSTSGGAAAALAPYAAAPARVDAFTRTKLSPPAPGEDNRFGNDVAIDGDTAVVGEWRGEGTAEDSGVAWAYGKQDGKWVRQAKLAPANGEANDRFGLSVAVSGDTIVVGAEYGTADGAAPHQIGAAYVYVRSGSTWVEQAQLFPTNRIVGGGFGADVAIDGDTIVVGAKYQGTKGRPLEEGGAAYVYARSGSTWTLQGQLESDDGIRDQLGASVAVDGDTVAAAATGDSTGPYDSDGAVYVFVRTGSTWTLQQRVTNPRPADNSLLGVELDLDGDTMIAQSNPAFSSPAKTHVFVRSGSSWTVEASLPLGPDDSLYGATALKDDVVLVGWVWGEAGSCSNACGVVYVFTRTGSTWAQKKVIPGPQGKEYDRFGSSVDFDGVSAIVGADAVRAPNGGPTEAGAAYVYDGST